MLDLNKEINSLLEKYQNLGKVEEGMQTDQANDHETNPLLSNIKCEYEVYNDILKEHHTAITNLVSMQAFQISACYNSANQFSFSENVKFYRIGLDETGIPIIVTRIGNENAQKKIVIAGPHGDERNALFAILETQKNFIKNEFTANDLILFFIPAISPTMFFADARGLPFIDNEISYDNITDGQIKSEVTKATNDALGGLTIPILHKRIAPLRTPIQGQADSLRPAHGIDTNRDVYNLLPSTVAFYNFVIGEARKNRNADTTTVFMIHGYENASDRGIRDRIITNPHQGTLCGPYQLDGNNGFIDEPMYGSNGYNHNANLWL